MHTSLLIVIAAIVILILAVVVVTIFTGGIDKFLQIWTGFSEEQLVRTRCQASCQEICTNTGTPSGWGSVKVGAKTYSCSAYQVTCDCSKYLPGGVTTGTKKKAGELCTDGIQCETSLCVSGVCNKGQDKGTACENSYDCKSGVCGVDKKCT